VPDGEVVAGHVGQRPAAPQRQRIPQLGGRLLAEAGPQDLARPGGHGLEPQSVYLITGHPEQVAIGLGGDERAIGVAQRLPEPLHIVVNRIPRRGWRSGLPEQLGHLVGRHRPARVEQQRGQQHTLLACRDRQQRLVPPHQQWPEQAEPRLKRH
jgi:hypothetical protein